MFLQLIRADSWFFIIVLVLKTIAKTKMRILASYGLNIRIVQRIKGFNCLWSLWNRHRIFCRLFLDPFILTSIEAWLTLYCWGDGYCALWGSMKEFRSSEVPTTHSGFYILSHLQGAYVPGPGIVLSPWSTKLAIVIFIFTSRGSTETYGPWSLFQFTHLLFAQ